MVREVNAENEVPRSKAAPVQVTQTGEPLMPGGLAGAVLDLDLSSVNLAPEKAEDMSRQLAQLTAEQRGDQFQRLERSLLRLERTNLQTLALLQKLVEALSTRRPEKADGAAAAAKTERLDKPEKPEKPEKPDARKK